MRFEIKLKTDVFFGSPNNVFTLKIKRNPKELVGQYNILLALLQKRGSREIVLVYINIEILNKFQPLKTLPFVPLKDKVIFNLLA